MSILEGLVKAETTINPTLNSNIDMSSKSGDTYNIDKVEVVIHIGNQQIEAVKEIAKEIANVLLQHQRSVNAQPANQPQ